MNSTSDAYEQQSCHDSSLAPGRTRSHSLKPRYSRHDYAPRKSAANAASTSYLELATENNELKRINTPPPRRRSTTYFQRRFTFFSLEQQQNPSNRRRRMTTGRFWISSNKSNSDLLKQKRPSIISQMFEVVCLSILCV